MRHWGNVLPLLCLAGHGVSVEMRRPCALAEECEPLQGRKWPQSGPVWSEAVARGCLSSDPFHLCLVWAPWQRSLPVPPVLPRLPCPRGPRSALLPLLFLALAPAHPPPPSSEALGNWEGEAGG